ncbi:MAG: phenylalanine--tRNA ligase subunit beta, partial [Gammaproteobacteria bacterium]|nr:phenylalanine--tRNA ligase subunit beta [Gammaproteobacteria bacterium]
MKFTTEWLSDFVSPPEATEALCERLTMSGLEVEAVASLDVPLERVVVARLVSAAPHPAADSLKVCEVDAGAHGMFQIVCGAPNARAGLMACLALPDGHIAGGVAVKPTNIRSVESNGMLCSAAEIGLGDDSSGLLELAADLTPGIALGELCPATDTLIELSLTPNRGDCLSLLGIARELGALANVECREPQTPAVAAITASTLPVSLAEPDACPVYAGRVLEDVDASVTTPLWMKERLRRCGVRSISIVVDVTNYVMLALGQPMHAFDLDRLQSGIEVRRPRPGETLVLLDGSEPELQTSDLVIADGAGPVALAGVMGGLASGVQAGTRRVFLESAWFNPIRIAGTARRLRLHTDASHRFERGVDPTGQSRAVEMATRLLVDLCGAQPGPLTLERAEGLPAEAPVNIRFRLDRANSLLGTDIGKDEALDIFRRLRLQVAREDGYWCVTPPPHRPDLGREEDLVEELARMRGYDRIPATSPSPSLQLAVGDNSRDELGRVQDALVSAGYLEAITYSFIAPELWNLFGEGLEPVALAN